MVIGLIICTLFGIALGWLGYQHFQKYDERRSDRRCNRTTLHRAYKTNIDHKKTIQDVQP